MRWDAKTNEISTFLEPAGRSNGLFFDHEQNLIACADEKFELWQISMDKQVTIHWIILKKKNSTAQ